MKEYKIGEKFIWEGKELVCVEEEEKEGSCEGCFLSFRHPCADVPCASRERKYGKAVIFKEVIKERDVKEKEEIKIVRKFEELAGLNNGKGLYLEKGLLHNDRNLFLKFKEELLQVLDLDSTDVEDVEMLKAMGFEFEWKPKPAEEEVLAKYKTVEFNYNSVNYTVTKNQDDSYVTRNITIHYLGAKYYTEKDMIAICRELNS